MVSEDLIIGMELNFLKTKRKKERIKKKKKEGKKKKECSQLVAVAGKIISMQIDFSAAKTSTEITEIMLNTVE